MNILEFVVGWCMGKSAKEMFFGVCVYWYIAKYIIISRRVNVVFIYEPNSHTQPTPPPTPKVLQRYVYLITGWIVFLYGICILNDDEL